MTVAIWDEALSLNIRYKVGIAGRFGYAMRENGTKR